MTSIMELLKQGAEKLGMHLTEKQIEQFAVYCRNLIDWNSRVNLTAITVFDEVQTKHFLDSLTLLPVMKELRPQALRMIDVGTGAGLPGIPLKIAWPDINLTLLEATSRKTEFLTYMVSTLGLENTDIITGRSEDIARVARHREMYDIVTARAVASLAALAELTLPLCAVGGICVLPKKGDTREEIDKAVNAIITCGGSLKEIRPVTLEGTEDNRHLVIIEKVSPTPDKYPRRPGMPEKRPIK